MSLFSNIEDDFKTINATGRSSSNELVSVTHVKASKNEVVFRLSKKAMDEAKLDYKDKVKIQFASDDTVCRILKSEGAGVVTLSQQSSKNEQSAGIIRLQHKEGIPDFLNKEVWAAGKQALRKVKYVHQEGMIEYGDGVVTFKLKLESSE